MERIFQLKKTGQYARPVATLGVFDGVHKGHLAILSETVDWARAIKGTSVVITFNRHPDTVVAARPPEDITSLEHRLNLIERAGVDVTLVLHFGRETADMEAADFARTVLVERLSVAGVVMGYNARFGKGAAGDAGLLSRMGQEHAFEVRTVKPLLVDGAPISSTRIRTLIKSGELEGAAALLGRPVSLRGKVVHGDKRGRELGFPTANLNLHHELTPPAGVYVGRVMVGTEALWGLVNIGFRPTFYSESAAQKSVEVYIDGYEGRLYGETVEVELVRYLRPEVKFSSAEALTLQMEQDRRCLESFRANSQDGQTA